MAFFKKRERAEPEQDNKEKNENDCDDLLISTYLGRKNITREMAEEIPAIQGNLDLIVKTAANVPRRLYKRIGKRVEEIENDHRVSLLNEDTGDTLDAKEMKQALFRDYFLGKGGYC